MRSALEYDQPSPRIKALLDRCASTLIVCDPSNLHIAFRLNLMDRHCNRVVMPVDPPHCMKNGFCLHTCITFPIYFNVSILRDLFSQLIPRRMKAALWANSFPANKIIPRVLRNPKHQFLVRKSCSLNPFIRQINRVHALSHFWGIILISSFHLHKLLPTGFFPSGFPA